MKMQTQRVDRLANASYESLNGADRLRVLLRHAAAGNADEAERVAAATPASAFRIAAPVFTDLCQAAWHLAREMATAITNAKASLVLLGEARLRLNLALPAAFSDWAQCRGCPNPAPAGADARPAWKSAETGFRAFEAACQPLDEALHDAVHVPTLELLRWHWAAFDQCCRERLGVEGRTLFEAYGQPSQLQFLDGVQERLGSLGLDEVQDDDKKAIEVIRKRLDELFRFVDEEEGQ